MIATNAVNLIFSVILLNAGLLVFTLYRHRKTHRIFSVACLNFGVTNGLMYLFNQIESPELAVIVLKIALTTFFFGLSGLMHCSYCVFSGHRYRKSMVSIFYLSGISFLILQISLFTPIDNFSRIDGIWMQKQSLYGFLLEPIAIWILGSSILGIVYHFIKLIKVKDIISKTNARLFLIHSMIPLFAFVILGYFFVTKGKALPPLVYLSYSLICVNLAYIAWRKKIGKMEASEIADDIVELIPGGLFIINDKGIIQQCNKAAARLIGVHINDLYGKAVISYFERKDKALTGADDQNLKRNMDIDNFIIRGDKTLIPVTYSVSNYRLPQSTITGKILIIRDVSNTHQMLDEIKDKEKFANTILDAIQDGISVMDRDHNIIKTNGWLKKLYGLKHDTSQKKCYKLLHNRESVCPWCPSAFTLNSGKSLSVVLPYPYLSSNPSKWLEITTFPIMNANGEVSGVIEYIKDITERKRAEDDLKSKTELLDQVFNGIQEGICLLDESHKIKYYNPAFASMLDRFDEMIMGEPIIDFINEENAGLLEFIQNPIEKIYEVQLKIDDGSKKFVRFHLSPRFDGDGNYQGSFGSMLDITESRLAEMNLAEYRLYLERLAITRTEELEDINMKLKQEINERKQAEVFLKEAKEDAERANQVKSQLIFNVSHEMRTPLNCIIGFTEIILNNNDINSIKSRAGTVLKESENLLMLINDLLDHAKIEAGKFDLEYQPLDLRQLITSIKNTTSVKCDEKGIDLIIEIQKNVPFYIRGDALRLRQVIMNLVGNAIKFTEQGHVKISIKMSEKSANKVKLLYAVEDTGIGIPFEKQNLIFRSFTQADGSTTRKYGGTGLGTTIARELVEQMGGKIKLDSMPGKGSTFYFEIVSDISQAPVMPEEMALSNDDSQVILNDNLRRTGNILLTEDYLPNQEMAMQHLTKVGYNVDIADNGKIALDKCKDKKYDLILMDVQMPIMDGYTAVKNIREGNSPNKGVPILAMTANADSTTRKKCLATGVNDVVTKPIRRKSFISTVDKWIDNGDSKSLKYKNPSNIIALNDDTEIKSSELPIDISVPLEEFGSMDDVIMILEHFMKSVEEQKASIKEALEARDGEMLRREFHSIKGAALTIEAIPLSRIAKKLESLAKDNKIDEIPKLMYDLSSEINRFNEYVKENVFRKAV